MEKQEKVAEIFQTYHKQEKIVEEDEQRNEKRQKVGEKKIKPLLNDFLTDNIGVEEFKRRNDGLNKRHKLWGFSGTAGAMFFNLLYEAATDKNQLSSHLKKHISAPRNLSEAKEEIDDFVEYVKEVGEHVEDPYKAPARKSTIFFLSYFWHIQEPNKFPIFYPNSRKALKNLNLYKEEAEKYGGLYGEFYQTIEQIREIFEQESGRAITLDEISNILSWYLTKTEEEKEEEIEEKQKEEKKRYKSYVPPIVASVPDIANSSEEMREKYGKEKLGSVFEQKVHEVFRLLGFQIKKLGQGKGVNPDGIAKAARGERYVIIYDTKVREETYKLGTEYRKIRDYIERYQRALKKRGYGDIYFMIISSTFKEGKDTQERLKYITNNTSAKNIPFLRAEYLISLLGIKIKNPDITLQNIKGLFNRNGVLKEEELENVVPSLPAI